MTNWTSIALAYPLNVPPSLHNVSSVAALFRHLSHIMEHEPIPYAAEYLAEIKRRVEATERKAA